MAHTISIPIKFRFIKIPVKWELREVPSHKLGPVPRLCGHPKAVLMESHSFSELNGWECRDEFLSLPENDTAALIEFMDKVGLWDVYSGSAALPYWPIEEMRVEPESVWELRETIRNALIYQKNFMVQVTPEIPTPKTLSDLTLGKQHPANDFQLRFELTKVASGVVTITNARNMLYATVLADIARGISFKCCKRKDCGKPFAIESEHERDYCRPYCGHLASVRRNRLKAKQEKRRKERKAKRG